MIWNLFRMTVPEKDQDIFNTVGQFNLETSYQNEPGTRMMMVTKEKETADQYWIIEHYQDEAAYEIHRNSPQFARFVAEGAVLVTSRSMTSLTVVGMNNQLPQQLWIDGHQSKLQVTIFNRTPEKTSKEVLSLLETHKRVDETWFLLQDKNEPEVIYMIEWNTFLKNEHWNSISLPKVEQKELTVMNTLNH